VSNDFYVAGTVDGHVRTDVVQAAGLLSRSLAAGGAIYVCGNGGSFADAQHFAGEFEGHYKRERPAMRVRALGSNPSAVTAISNDLGYEYIFARELEAWGKPGDVLVALSTSGKSKNVKRAISVATSRGMHVVGLVGRSAQWVVVPPSIVIAIDSDDTAEVQDVSRRALHVIAGLVEDSWKSI
jgi:phosphoheptose isomerase